MPGNKSVTPKPAAKAAPKSAPPSKKSAAPRKKEEQHSVKGKPKASKEPVKEKGKTKRFARDMLIDLVLEATGAKPYVDIGKLVWSGLEDSGLLPERLASASAIFEESLPKAKGPLVTRLLGLNTTSPLAIRPVIGEAALVVVMRALGFGEEPTRWHPTAALVIPLWLKDALEQAFDKYCTDARLLFPNDASHLTDEALMTSMCAERCPPGIDVTQLSQLVAVFVQPYKGLLPVNTEGSVASLYTTLRLVMLVMAVSAVKTTLAPIAKVVGQFHPAGALPGVQTVDGYGLVKVGKVDGLSGAPTPDEVARSYRVASAVDTMTSLDSRPPPLMTTYHHPSSADSTPHYLPQPPRAPHEAVNFYRPAQLAGKGGQDGQFVYKGVGGSQDPRLPHNPRGVSGTHSHQATYGGYGKIANVKLTDGVHNTEVGAAYDFSSHSTHSEMSRDTRRGHDGYVLKVKQPVAMVQQVVGVNNLLTGIGTTTLNGVNSIELAPDTLGNRLAEFARLFDRATLEHFRLMYSPTCPTSTAGNIAMGVIMDPDIGAYNTAVQSYRGALELGSNHESYSTSFNVWNPAEIAGDYRKNADPPSCFTEYVSGSTAARRQTAWGQVIAYPLSVGVGTPPVLGVLTIEMEVFLYQPVPDMGFTLMSKGRRLCGRAIWQAVLEYLLHEPFELARLISAMGLREPGSDDEFDVLDDWAVRRGLMVMPAQAPIERLVRAVQACGLRNHNASCKVEDLE